MSRFRLNSNNVSSFFSNEDSLKCKIKQVALKCQKSIEHFSFDVEEFHSYIADYLIPYIYYDPLYWYSNPLIGEIKKHIGNEIPMCFLSELEAIEQDEAFCKSLTGVKKNIEEVLLLNENINEEEALELLNIGILFDDFYPDLICNYLMGKILEGKIKISDNDYQRLFFRFVELFKRRNGLSCYFTKGIFENKFDENGVIITDAVIKVKNGTYRIIFNEERLSCEYILDNLKTLFHEVWHFVQKNPNYSSLYYRELFIMDTFLAKIKGEYGNNNYDLMADEADAFLNENVLLYQYLARVSKSVFEREKDDLLKTIRVKGIRRDNLERRDQFGNVIYLDEYFEKIAKMYKINPYSDLGLIYTYDFSGRRLRPLELFKRMENLDIDSELYNYYKTILFNSNYAYEDLPLILRELKAEIDISRGNYLLLIEIYWIYVKQYLNNIRNSHKNNIDLEIEVAKLVFV